MKNNLRIIFCLTVITITLFLSSCSKKVERNGYLVNSSSINLINTNKTSEEEVVNILGEPTTTSTFLPKTYYYMERKYSQVAFFSPKLLEQKIISIEFTPKNIVKSIIIYTAKDAHDLDYDIDQITFEGNKVGVFEQVIGNLGKFSSNAQKRNAN
jgi:outer membrane protein assembly factor BamE (lipoprotein component of BamABCDE complex)